ncbi:MAG: class I fructose-bisphosphate aldolase [Labedaea sp.]
MNDVTTTTVAAPRPCGKWLRMRRLFAGDGRMLIVAMDHALYLGPANGLDLETAAEAAAAGADAIMTSFGAARGMRDRTLELHGAAVVVSLDTDATDPERQLINALKLGADAVKVYVAGSEAAQWRSLSAYAQVCEQWAVPLLAEVIPGGFDQPEHHTPTAIAHACRRAAELGADLVKTLYTGDPDTMAQVVQGATVPVVILGGEVAQSMRELTDRVRDACRAGVAGIAFGRNIWASPHPAATVTALAQAVHGPPTTTAAAGVTHQ